MKFRRVDEISLKSFSMKSRNFDDEQLKFRRQPKSKQFQMPGLEIDLIVWRLRKFLLQYLPSKKDKVKPLKLVPFFTFKAVVNVIKWWVKLLSNY